MTHNKGERHIARVNGVKMGCYKNLVTISGWRPQVWETPVYKIKDTDQNENKREFLVISRITHVMNKRSYFSHHFLNEVSHTGVNLDNPRNCIRGEGPTKKLKVPYKKLEKTNSVTSGLQ